MPNGISAETIQKVATNVIKKGATKINPAIGTASVGLDLTSLVTKRTLGFDFLNFLIGLGLMYVIAWVFEIYMKANLFFDQPVGDGRDQGEVIKTSLIQSIFGFGGLLFNLFTLPDDPESDEVRKKITENKIITDLFSEKGYKGFRYWNIVNGFVLITIIATYFNHKNNNNGKVAPITTIVFLLLFLGVGIIGFRDLFSRFKKTDLGLEQFR